MGLLLTTQGRALKTGRKLVQTESFKSIVPSIMLTCQIWDRSYKTDDFVDHSLHMSRMYYLGRFYIELAKYN